MTERNKVQGEGMKGVKSTMEEKQRKFYDKAHTRITAALERELRQVSEEAFRKFVVPFCDEHDVDWVDCTYGFMFVHRNPPPGLPENCIEYSTARLEDEARDAESDLEQLAYLTPERVRHAEIGDAALELEYILNGCLLSSNEANVTLADFMPETRRF